MALRALFFSKNPDTAAALSSVLQESGIRPELCADIFTAIEKATKQPFACIIADWVDQPEAGFLFKRARESGVNRSAVAVAIVDGDPSPEEEREHRLDFLIYRPIADDEARAVLAKARQQMLLHHAAFATDPDSSPDRPEVSGAQPPPEDPNLVATAADLPETLDPAVPPEFPEQEATIAEAVVSHHPSRAGARLRIAAVVVLMSVAAYCVWSARASFRYLATAREGTARVLRESLTIFYNSQTGAPPTHSVAVETQPDAYFVRSPATNSQPAPLKVVSAGVEVSETDRHLRAAFDFPLPTPELHFDPLPVRPRRAPLPESLRSSAPITPPPSLTVTPGQIMPVSTPPPVTPIASQYGDSIRLTEDAARALVVHTVDPIYPSEARAQKLDGPVVLQAVIGRDGAVQDLKLVRGYFVLGKAAIAAVKQWRFRPSTINGRPVEAQTVITINFTYPSS